MIKKFQGSSFFSRFFLAFGAVFLFIFLAVFAVILFLSSNQLRDFAGNKGSALLGREFSIDGEIDVDWDWSAPKVFLHKVRIANLAESKDPDMLTIKELNFQIKIWRLFLGELNLPSIALIKPKILLEKFTSTTKNWDFPPLPGVNITSKAVLPEDRHNFPVIGVLLVEDGNLTFRDKPKKLLTILNIDTAKGGLNALQETYQLSGQGTLQEKAFSIQAKGGSLAELRHNTSPYPLTLNIKMGSTSISFEGTLADPVQLQGVNAKLDLRGDNLADLFYLTGIPLPPTPPYKLSGDLQNQGQIWRFKKLKGQVGDSDLTGELTYDIHGDRGFVKADLVSKRLDMNDLSGFIGSTPSGGIRSPAQKIQAKVEKANPHLLPDVPINLIRLRAADMDIRLRAKKINAPNWPIDDLDISFKLDKGILRLDPLNFGVADGTISGNLVLDGQNKIPHVESDLLIKRLSIKQFFNDPEFEALSAGHFGGQLKLKGRGHSLADVLATSNGRITLMMAGGKISLLIIEAAGLDIGQATPLLLGEDRSTDIRCAIGDFKVENGLLNSEIFVFDTTDSNIAGNMHINLKDETIDAKAEVHPKDFSVLSARTPITVSGTLKHPSIGLDAEELAIRSASAVVLGVFLMPAAAIIPFIEMGLGEDSDCRDLIQQARSPIKARTTSRTITKRKFKARQKRR
jgi:AsmA family protein